MNKGREKGDRRAFTISDQYKLATISKPTPMPLLYLYVSVLVTATFSLPLSTTFHSQILHYLGVEERLVV